jgi:hypothetical protein
MPSSISAFKDRPLLRAAIVLIAGCVAIGVAAELAARVGLDRISKTQRRMAEEYRQAIVRSRTDGRRVALFLGNSVLDEGVRFDRVRDRLAPEWDARRFVVEQTFYNDWLYGLRRLLREGAQPDVVVIALTPVQWIRDDIRGDYSAQYLMTTRDAAAAARELHMHPTEGANFLFASLSKFWGTRAEIRNVVLGRIMPDIDRLMTYSAVISTAEINDAEIERVVAVRLARMRELTDAHGARLLALVVPVLNPVDGAKGLVNAGAQAGVPVLAPVNSGTYPSTFYRDGFHLNSTGADRFTEQLVEPLQSTLEKTVGDAGRLRAARTED